MEKYRTKQHPILAMLRGQGEFQLITGHNCLAAHLCRFSVTSELYYSICHNQFIMDGQGLF